MPLPFRQELWAMGQDTHAAWAAAKLPHTCSFFNVYGSGLSTPYDAVYGAWWYPLQVGGVGGVCVCTWEGVGFSGWRATGGSR